jgi:hypothetical protein
MVVKLKMFCEKQTACEENFDNEGNQLAWTCTAHLAEDRVFNCIYKSLKERMNAEHIPFAYPCADFKLVVGEQKK